MATKRKTSKKKPSALACKRRGRALATKRTASAGKSLAACRRPAKRASVRNGGYSQSDIDYLNEQFSADGMRRREADLMASVPDLSKWLKYSLTGDGYFGYVVKVTSSRSYSIVPTHRVEGRRAGYTLRSIARHQGHNDSTTDEYVGLDGRAITRLRDLGDNIFRTPQQAVLAARSHYRDNI